MTANSYLAAAAIASIWLAAAALAWIVVRAVGWPAVKRHGVALAVVCISLLGVPGAVAIKLALPYRDRIAARIWTVESPAVQVTQECGLFPANNIWNVPVRDLPVDPRSAAYIDSIGREVPLHADFSIAYDVVTESLPAATVTFGEGTAESDPGPYVIPENAAVEPAPDSHVLVLDQHACRLYELFAARRTGTLQWEAESGAVFDLRSNRLRPMTWTSADASGLPILPGLVRYDEVHRGAIRHALRFTARATRRDVVWPARHFASRLTDASLPPMGQRFRLKAAVDTSAFAPETRVILTALKDYGMFLSDNGSSWYVTGGRDSRWPQHVIDEMRQLHGSDFEAVDTSSLMIDADSAEARRP